MLLFIESNYNLFKTYLIFKIMMYVRRVTIFNNRFYYLNSFLDSIFFKRRTKVFSAKNSEQELVIKERGSIHGNVNHSLF